MRGLGQKSGTKKPTNHFVAVSELEARVANRLRVDAAQDFNLTQKAQGRVNLGLAALAESGNADDISDGTAKVAMTIGERAKLVKALVKDENLAGLINLFDAKVNLTLHQAVPTAVTNYDATPATGVHSAFIHGTDSVPTTDGTQPSFYRQRVDSSILPDNPGYLIYGDRFVFKRAAGGSGWIQAFSMYLEDGSDTGFGQSVGIASKAIATPGGKSAVWGLYGEGISYSALATPTAIELDAFNHTGSNYVYKAANPVDGPHSKGGWIVGGGEHRNSFALGIGQLSVAGRFYVGLYTQAASLSDFGFDLQASPTTGIFFRNGATVGGLGVTPGGIGIDFGPNAKGYGTAADQGAIHLHSHRLQFGPSVAEGGDGLSFMQFDTVLKVVISGQTRFEIGTGEITPGIANAINLGTAAKPWATTRSQRFVMTGYASLNFADDAAAAAGGVGLGQAYHTSGVGKWRLT